MYKPTIAFVVIGFGFLGWRGAESDRSPGLKKDKFLGLKEEAMTLEYTAALDEAVLIVEAETESGLGRVEVHGPGGEPLFNLRRGDAQNFALSGFVVETRETSAKSVFRAYPEGVYDIRAWTVEGQRLDGSATLSHDLLPAPIAVYPFEGAVNVSTTPLVVWINDPEATGYRVVLEQNDNDGLMAELSAGTNSFHVPAGILAPDTKSQLEIGAIGANGNSTLVEISFFTGL